MGMFAFAGSAAVTQAQAQAQDAARACQDTIKIERGDTISAIAERCDLSETRLLALNPGVEGSSDLVVGQRISTKTDAAGAGGQLWSDFKNAVGETSSALENVAKGINSSAQDILAKNPDLRSRIENLGSSLNMSGEGSSASVAVQIVPKTEQADIRISAKGLPSNVDVGINIGAVGSASENVARIRTGSKGTLSESVRLPGWLPRDKRLVVTITGDEHNVLARSISTSVTTSSE